MGLLTFSINVTLDGCVDHREGIADDETHAYFTRLMDEAGAMLWGRITYEMMESAWPAAGRRGGGRRPGAAAPRARGERAGERRGLEEKQRGREGSSRKTRERH